MGGVNSNLPGRLGNPEATLDTDPRADPRIVAAMARAGELAPGVDPVGANSTYEECLDYFLALEEALALAHPRMLAATPELGVRRSTEVITGVDGNDINLFIHQPNRDASLPCILHIHGGGLVWTTAADPGFVRWRDWLANMGMVVVGVEFRNGGGKLGNHPFPAGLNDCARATQWVFENKGRLGISSIVISGESGGGNLSIATTLKANKEGWVNQIDGVYAMCPLISGAYSNPPAHLLSLAENDQYMLDGSIMGAFVKVYDPHEEHGTNPLAWPLQAEVGDLQGLPPHVISVNELDPLRDEGLAYYRKLLAAGVSAIGRTVHGTPHAGDISMPDVVPEVYSESARSVYGFASSLLPVVCPLSGRSIRDKRR